MNTTTRCVVCRDPDTSPHPHGGYPVCATHRHARPFLVSYNADIEVIAVDEQSALESAGAKDILEFLHDVVVQPVPFGDE